MEHHRQPQRPADVAHEDDGGDEEKQQGGPKPLERVLRPPDDHERLVHSDEIGGHERGAGHQNKMHGPGREATADNIEAKKQNTGRGVEGRRVETKRYDREWVVRRAIHGLGGWHLSFFPMDARACRCLLYDVAGLLLF